MLIGIMLWGFWELSMSRDNANLVEGEGEINEAGKRFLKVKQEWLSHAYGIINDELEFTFKGYHGTYAVEVCTPAGIVLKTFVVEKGDTPLVISIDLSSL